MRLLSPLLRCHLTADPGGGRHAARHSQQRRSSGDHRKLRAGDLREAAAQHPVRTLLVMCRVQSDLFTDYRSVDNPATKAWAGWVRELAELAAVFVTVGAAHLLAALLGHQQNGAVMLIGLGVTLVAVAAVLRTALHRPATSAQPGARTGPRRGGRARLRRRAERHTAALRGARRGHTLWRIRTTVPDEPGSLAQLCASLSRLGVNILSVELHPLGEVVADELIVDAPPGVGAGELLPAARSGP